MSQRKRAGFRFPRSNFSEKTALHKNFRYLERFLERLALNDTTPASVTVAASDSVNKNAADFVADGQNDDEQIIAAQQKVGANGVVHLRDGNYYIGSSINLNALGGLRLRGESSSGTIIRPGTGFTGTMLAKNGSLPAALSADHVGFDGFDVATIFGDSGTDISGWVLNDCVVQRSAGNGVSAGRGADWHVTNCVIHDNAVRGVSVEDGLLRISNCHVFDNATEGISLRRHGNLSYISHNRIRGNGGAGMLLDGSTSTPVRRLAVTGNVTENNSFGCASEVGAFSPFQTLITGNIFRDGASGDARNFAHNDISDIHEIGWHSGITFGDITDFNVTAAAKGDVLVFDGTDWVDLTVGANGQYLTAASAETTGLLWSSLTASSEEGAFVPALMLGGM